MDEIKKRIELLEQERKLLEEMIELYKQLPERTQLPRIPRPDDSYPIVVAYGIPYPRKY